MTDGSTRLGGPARSALRRGLSPSDPAWGFAEAVVLQATRAAAAGAAAQAELAERTLALLRVRQRRAGTEPPAELVEDPVLLAAFFQNLDLLYAGNDPHADTVAGWIMSAVEALWSEEAEG